MTEAALNILYKLGLPGALGIILAAIIIVYIGQLNLGAMLIVIFLCIVLVFALFEIAKWIGGAAQRRRD